MGARGRWLLVAVLAAGSVTVPVGTQTTGARIETEDVVSAAWTGRAGFIGLVPARLLDTRSGPTIDGAGAGGGPVGPGGTVDVVVVGRGGVPTDGVAAVALNVTVTEPTAPSFVTIFPASAGRPTASNLNLVPGQTVANMVIVPVGTNGRVSIYNNSGNAHVIVDIAGWFAVGSSFTGLTPARLMDSRGAPTIDGAGAGGGPIGAGGQADLRIAGRSGLPASDVGAVVLNVTVTDPTAASFLTVFPAGGQRPTASNLNFVPGQTVPNLVVVPLGVDGKVSIFNNSGNVHVVVDIAGWFAVGSSFTGLTPARLMDTRAAGTTIDGMATAGGPVGAGGQVELGVLGRGGVPSSGVGAVALNVTVTEPNAASFLTVFPTGSARPTASNLNVVPGQTVPNMVIVPVGASGQVSIYNFAGDAHVIVDVAGWFLTSSASLTVDAFSVPSEARLAAADLTPTGARQLQDEVWVTLGTPEAPGTQAAAEALAAQFGAAVVGGFADYGAFQIRFPGPIDQVVINEAIAGFATVDMSSPSRWGTTTTAADPPGDWDDDRNNNDVTWPFDMMNTRSAWDSSTGSSTLVGIVDQGTAFRGHEDLDVRFPEGKVIQTGPHATHVAGLACARANGKGLVGVAWGCPVVSVGTDADWNNQISDYEIFAGALAAMDAGVKVINISLGRPSGCISQATANQAAAEYASSASLFQHLIGSAAGKKIVWTFSAGNNCVKGVMSSMGQAAVAAKYANVLIVDAVNDDRSLASFSNFATGGNEIAAPGGVKVPSAGGPNTGVWSTYTQECPIITINTCTSYAQDYGTSMAAPMVAGVAALVITRYPNKSAGEVVSCITSGAVAAGKKVTVRSDSPTRNTKVSNDPIDTPLYVVDAAAAVACAEPASAPQPQPQPQPIPAPGGSFGVALSENPFRCDGGSRVMGALSGALAGERITFSSPTVSGLLPGNADGNGTLSIRWQCIPSEAGQSWQLTARGQISGKTSTFTITGAGGSSPTPVGSLTVAFSENPFRCDGGSRTLGTLSGAQAGEPIIFTSPTVSGLLPGTADGNGNLRLIWQCNPGEAGQSWTVTAVGGSSGRRGDFTVTGYVPAPPQPTLFNEKAWGPPGGSVPLFSGGPGVNSNGASGPAARIPVGTVIQTNCRSYNLAVAPSNSGGWWYRIAAGTYNGYWTPASVYENGSGPYPNTGGLWDPAVPVC